MKQRRNLTDRAKRYRAQRNKPAGPKLCAFCARRRNIDVDHIDGDETDSSPENLMYLCRPCNTTKGIVQARNRIGIRTRQYNPARVTFAQWKRAARVLLGAPGSAADATAVIKATTPDQRAKFAAEIAADNPFKSEAQRRKFFAMAARGEISRKTLKEFESRNPAAIPTFAQYAHGVSVHRRGRKDEGGAIIHATPPAVRSKYAREIARRKRQRGEIPF